MQIRHVPVYEGNRVLGVLSVKVAHRCCQSCTLRVIVTLSCCIVQDVFAQLLEASGDA